MTTPYLSARDRHYLDGLAAGLRNNEIAAQLGMKESAVNTALWRLYCRLGTANRAEAAVWWVRETEVKGKAS